MTQKQKAKAYDMALERAKQVRKYSSDLAEIKRMEEIFPELCESKDEKIRGTLLSVFKEAAERIGDNRVWDSGITYMSVVAWLEKQGQVKESEIPQPIKETSKENDNSLTIQNGIILDGVVYELTTGFPDNSCSLCGNCELNEKCIEFDGSLCYFFADNFRKVFRKVNMKREL